MTPLEHAKSMVDFCKGEIARMDIDNHRADTEVCLAVDEFENALDQFLTSILEIE